MNGNAAVDTDFPHLVQQWARQHGLQIPTGALPEHQLPSQEELLAEAAGQQQIRGT